MKNSSPDNDALAILWQAFRAGDQQAYTQLLRQVYSGLFGYATKFTKDRELIKDCLQDMFTELWYKRESLHSIHYIKIYLFTSLRNNLLSQLRETGNHTGREAFSETILVTDGQNIEVVTIWQELTRLQEHEIRQAIQELSSRQQEVIFLKFYEGLSNEAIAHIMGIGRQPVANLLHKAISHLKQLVAYRSFYCLLVWLVS